jgi:hypothetical protein
MISKIEMTLDFVKASKKASKLVKELTLDLYESKDIARIIKNRIKDSINYRGDKLRNLEKSTRNIRKMRGISGTKPLIETGKLLNSIKNVKTKNKIGIRMNEYGVHQSRGFTTNNHFAIKRNNKIVGWRDYSDGRYVPPRSFIYPPEKGKKSTISEDPLREIQFDDTDKKFLIKKLKKILRHKKVITIK